eukprot:1008315-Amphidinium_carterae.1
MSFRCDEVEIVPPSGSPSTREKGTARQATPRHFSRRSVRNELQERRTVSQQMPLQGDMRVQPELKRVAMSGHQMEFGMPQAT